jgi:hypothetical protein
VLARAEYMVDRRHTAGGRSGGLASKVLQRAAATQAGSQWAPVYGKKFGDLGGITAWAGCKIVDFWGRTYRSRFPPANALQPASGSGAAAAMASAAGRRARALQLGTGSPGLVESTAWASGYLGSVTK